MTESASALIKGILIVSAWLWYQTSELTGGLVDEAFDKMFSLGLLIVVLVILFREYRKSQEYNRERDEKMEQLLIGSTEAINANTEALNRIEKQMDRQ